MNPDEEFSVMSCMFYFPALLLLDLVRAFLDGFDCHACNPPRDDLAHEKGVPVTV